jgi:hypothetical protein
MDQGNRAIQQGNKSVYAENNVYITYGDKRIGKNLTSPPFVTNVFIGREADMDAVRQRLSNGHLLLLVNGEGGIGKTTLAAHYYQRYAETYQHLAWVFAESSLLHALLSLAPVLQIDFPPDLPERLRLERLLAAMADLQKPCLLVIDNANRLEDLENYYQALTACPNFHILLTSRITEFAQTARYQIKPLPVAEATARQLVSTAPQLEEFKRNLDLVLARLSEL